LKNLNAAATTKRHLKNINKKKTKTPVYNKQHEVKVEYKRKLAKDMNEYYNVV